MDKIYGYTHRGGINLWMIVNNRDEALANQIEQETKNFRKELSKYPKAYNLLTPMQIASIPSYRKSNNSNQLILYTGISTKKDLTPKQIEIFNKALEAKGYEIKNLYIS